MPRLTRQFVDGKYFDYPVNFGQVVKNLGPAGAAARIGIDYVLARLRYGLLQASRCAPSRTTSSRTSAARWPSSA